MGSTPSSGTIPFPLRTAVLSKLDLSLFFSMRVEGGQKILIRNTETLEEQFVREIHVTPTAESKTEVGAEFLRPAPKFWRISSPTTGRPTTRKSPPTPSNALTQLTLPLPVICYLFAAIRLQLAA